MKTLTAGALSAKEAQSLTYDILVESTALDLHYSFATTTAGGFSWEHRIKVNGLSDITHEAPAGGGIAAISTIRLLVVDDGQGQSITAKLASLGHIRDVDLVISLLFAGENYADRICLFPNGVIVDFREVGAMTMELTVADRTWRAERLLPRTIIPVQSENAPTENVGQALPLLYGKGADIQHAPMLLTDATARSYAIAAHALRVAPLSTLTYGPYVPTAQRVPTRLMANDGILTAADATYVLAYPITALPTIIGTTLYGGGLAGTVAGTTLVVQREQDVTDSANLIDTLTGTFAEILTDTLTDGNGDGYGYAGVAATWPDPEGLNVLRMTVHQHQGFFPAAATVNGRILVRVLDAAGNVVGEPLLTQSNLRWYSGPRDDAQEFQNIALAAGHSIEVLIEARNDGGLGGPNDRWRVGGVTMVLGYRPSADREPLFMVGSWQGRPDDAAGTYTGTASGLIEHPVDLQYHLLAVELGLTVDLSTLATARARLPAWVFGGGIGAGWSTERVEARLFLDSLARQSSSLILGCDDGYRVLPFRSDDPSRYDFTTDTILWTAGVNAETPPSQRRSTFAINPEPVGARYIAYELSYAYNPTYGGYDKVLYCTPDGTNSPGIGASSLVDMCLYSRNRHGETDTFTIECPFIYDDDTAAKLLAHLVQYFWTHRLVATFETGMQGVHLEVGDFITIDYPNIPTSGPTSGAFNPSVFDSTVFDVSGGLPAWEVHRITYRFVPVDSGEARGLSFRTNILASKLAAEFFEYITLDDQTGTTHYWWIVGDTLAFATTAPTHQALLITDATSGGPYEWLQVDAIDIPTTQMYLWPHPSGAILVDTSPPPIGSGWDIGAGLTLRGKNGNSHMLAAHSAGTYSIEEV